MSIVAKFVVNEVRKEYENDICTMVRMLPVTPDTGQAGDEAFWKATPSGELKLYIDNDKALQQLQVGQYWYLEFVQAAEHGGREYVSFYPVCGRLIVRGGMSNKTTSKDGVLEFLVHLKMNATGSGILCQRVKAAGFRINGADCTLEFTDASGQMVAMFQPDVWSFVEAGQKE